MTDAYAEGYARIFGDKRPERGRFIQDPDTLKLVPAGEYVPKERPQYAAIHGPLEAFVSPIDGTVIDDRAKLRAHNKRHGVTNVQDYGPDWFPRKAAEREAALRADTPKAKRERVEAIQHALHSLGYN